MHNSATCTGRMHRGYFFGDGLSLQVFLEFICFMVSKLMNSSSWTTDCTLSETKSWPVKLASKGHVISKHGAFGGHSEANSKLAHADAAGRGRSRWPNSLWSDPTWLVQICPTVKTTKKYMNKKGQKTVQGGQRPWKKSQAYPLNSAGHMSPSGN